MTVARILFLADTHLGFDLPLRPRIERRRRGHDFFDNYERVLDAALAERVDAIVHGGDLLYRSRVPARLVQQAFAPLKRMAEVGVPVYLVPGNHERSHIPHAMLALHPRIHVFDRPQTFALEAKGLRLALAGFPCERKEARKRFAALVEDTGWRDAGAAVNLLCVHQAFEGATVGPSDFTFRSGDDVVRGADVPAPFAAVLAGHVHRHQVLTSDLGGRPLPTPVLYPGSIERTSFAEKDEPKGCLLLEVGIGDSPGGVLRSWEFRRLPARPMLVRELDADGADRARLLAMVMQAVGEAPTDAVLRLRIHGRPAAEARAVLGAASLRSIAPATMNVEAVLVDERRPPLR